jgi:hypothetical protein
MFITPHPLFEHLLPQGEKAIIRKTGVYFLLPLWEKVAAKQTDEGY